MSLPTTADVIALGIAVAGSTAAAIVDLRTRRVPNALTMGMAAAGIGLAVMRAGPLGLAVSLAGCVLGAVLMLPGHVLGGTGAGDVKLLAASGALLGPAPTFHAFVATVIAGGVLALAVATRRGRLRRTLDATRRLALADGRSPRLRMRTRAIGSRARPPSRSGSSWRPRRVWDSACRDWNVNHGSHSNFHRPGNGAHGRRRVCLRDVRYVQQPPPSPR